MRIVIMVGVLLAGCVGFGRTQGPATPLGKAEKRLARLLEPHAQEDGAALRQPPARLAPRFLALPEAPLPLPSLPPPAPPKPAVKVVAPRPIAEEAPFVRDFTAPAPPQPIQLPAGPLARTWTWDVAGPLPIPILAHGVRDRASLADPTLEASIAAGQAKLHPARTQPVPFQAQNLPDPFENAEAIRLRTPVDELPAPPLTVNPLSRR